MPAGLYIIIRTRMMPKSRRWYLAGSSCVGQILPCEVDDRYDRLALPELRQVQREALQYLQVEHDDDSGSDDHARYRADAAQDDHGQHADRLHEVEGIRADEGPARGEEHAHASGKRRADGKRYQLHLVCRYAHGGGRQLVLADGCPCATNLGIIEPLGNQDGRDDYDERYEVEEYVVELADRYVCCLPAGPRSR